MDVSNQPKIVGNSKVDSILDDLEKLRDDRNFKERAIRLARESERIKKEVESNLKVYRISRIHALVSCLGIEGYLLEKLSNDQLAILTDNSLQKIQRKAKWAKYLPKFFLLWAFWWWVFLFFGEVVAVPVFVGVAALISFFALVVYIFSDGYSCKKFVEARNYLQKNGALPEEKGVPNE